MGALRRQGVSGWYRSPQQRHTTPLPATLIGQSGHDALSDLYHPPPCTLLPTTNLKYFAKLGRMAISHWPVHDKLAVLGWTRSCRADLRRTVIQVPTVQKLKLHRDPSSQVRAGSVPPNSIPCYYYLQHLPTYLTSTTSARHAITT